MAKNNEKNYLDYIPQHNPLVGSHVDDDDKLVLDIHNTGIFNKMAQKLFSKPEITQIHLDEMGMFIWPIIDGEKTIFAIGEEVKKEFGEKAEPLYERLVKYFQIMESNGLITLINK